MIQGLGFFGQPHRGGSPFEPKRVCLLREGPGACLYGLLALSALSSHLRSPQHLSQRPLQHSRGRGAGWRGLRGPGMGLGKDKLS